MANELIENPVINLVTTLCHREPAVRCAGQRQACGESVINHYGDEVLKVFAAAERARHP